MSSYIPSVAAGTMLAAFLVMVWFVSQASGATVFPLPVCNVTIEGVGGAVGLRATVASRNWNATLLGNCTWKTLTVNNPSGTVQELKTNYSGGGGYVDSMWVDECELLTETFQPEDVCPEYYALVDHDNTNATIFRRNITVQTTPTKVCKSFIKARPSVPSVDLDGCRVNTTHLTECSALCPGELGAQVFGGEPISDEYYLGECSLDGLGVYAKNCTAPSSWANNSCVFDPLCEPWSEWSECSESLRMGIRTSVRSCRNGTALETRTALCILPSAAAVQRFTHIVNRTDCDHPTGVQYELELITDRTAAIHRASVKAYSCLDHHQTELCVLGAWGPWVPLECPRDNTDANFTQTRVRTHAGNCTEEFVHPTALTQTRKCPFCVVADWVPLLNITEPMELVSPLQPSPAAIIVESQLCTLSEQLGRCGYYSIDCHRMLWSDANITYMGSCEHRAVLPVAILHFREKIHVEHFIETSNSVNCSYTQIPKSEAVDVCGPAILLDPDVPDNLTMRVCSNDEPPPYIFCECPNSDSDHEVKCAEYGYREEACKTAEEVLMFCGIGAIGCSLTCLTHPDGDLAATECFDLTCECAENHTLVYMGNNTLDELHDHPCLPSHFATPCNESIYEAECDPDLGIDYCFVVEVTHHLWSVDCHYTPPCHTLGTYASLLDDPVVCYPCPVNQFQNTTMQEECHQCPPGYHAPNRGSTSCDPCPMGRFRINHEETLTEGCQPCDQGKYAAELGTASCSNCPSGTVASSVETVNCYPCPDGYIANEDRITCDLCGPGTHSSDSEMCHDCQVGRFANISGLSICYQCEPGTYADDEGFVSCEPCEEGKFSEFEQEECSDCPDELEHCLLCQPGFLTTFNFTCIGCPAGRFNPTWGASQCVDCESGRFSSDNASDCTPCESGVTSVGPGYPACNTTVSLFDGDASIPSNSTDELYICDVFTDSWLCNGGAAVTQQHLEHFKTKVPSALSRIEFCLYHPTDTTRQPVPGTCSHESYVRQCQTDEALDYCGSEEAHCLVKCPLDIAGGCRHIGGCERTDNCTALEFLRLCHGRLLDANQDGPGGPCSVLYNTLTPEVREFVPGSCGEHHVYPCPGDISQIRCGPSDAVTNCTWDWADVRTIECECEEGRGRANLPFVVTDDGRMRLLRTSYDGACYGRLRECTEVEVPIYGGRDASACTLSCVNVSTPNDPTLGENCTLVEYECNGSPEPWFSRFHPLLASNRLLDWTFATPCGPPEGMEFASGYNPPMRHLLATTDPLTTRPCLPEEAERLPVTSPCDRTNYFKDCLFDEESELFVPDPQGCVSGGAASDYKTMELDSRALFEYCGAFAVYGTGHCYVNASMRMVCDLKDTKKPVSCRCSKLPGEAVYRGSTGAPCEKHYIVVTAKDTVQAKQFCGPGAMSAKLRCFSDSSADCYASDECHCVGVSTAPADYCPKPANLGVSCDDDGKCGPMTAQSYRDSDGNLVCACKQDAAFSLPHAQPCSLFIRNCTDAESLNHCGSLERKYSGLNRTQLYYTCQVLCPFDAAHGHPDTCSLLNGTCQVIPGEETIQNSISLEQTLSWRECFEQNETELCTYDPIAATSCMYEITTGTAVCTCNYTIAERVPSTHKCALRWDTWTQCSDQEVQQCDGVDLVGCHSRLWWLPKHHSLAYAVTLAKQQRANDPRERIDPDNMYEKWFPECIYPKQPFDTICAWDHANCGTKVISTADVARPQSVTVADLSHFLLTRGQPMFKFGISKPDRVLTCNGFGTPRTLDPTVVRPSPTTFENGNPEKLVFSHDSITNTMPLFTNSPDQLGARIPYSKGQVYLEPTMFLNAFDAAWHFILTGHVLVPINTSSLAANDTFTCFFGSTALAIDGCTLDQATQRVNCRLPFPNINYSYPLFGLPTLVAHTNALDALRVDDSFGIHSPNTRSDGITRSIDWEFGHGSKFFNHTARQFLPGYGNHVEQVWQLAINNPGDPNTPIPHTAKLETDFWLTPKLHKELVRLTSGSIRWFPREIFWPLIRQDSQSHEFSVSTKIYKYNKKNHDPYSYFKAHAASGYRCKDDDIRYILNKTWERDMGVHGEYRDSVRAPVLVGKGSHPERPWYGNYSLEANPWSDFSFYGYFVQHHANKDDIWLYTLLEYDVVAVSLYPSCEIADSVNALPHLLFPWYERFSLDDETKLNAAEQKANLDFKHRLVQSDLKWIKGKGLPLLVNRFKSYDAPSDISNHFSLDAFGLFKPLATFSPYPVGFGGVAASDVVKGFSGVALDYSRAFAPLYCYDELPEDTTKTCPLTNFNAHYQVSINQANDAVTNIGTLRNCLLASQGGKTEQTLVCGSRIVEGFTNYGSGQGGRNAQTPFGAISTQPDYMNSWTEVVFAKRPSIHGMSAVAGHILIPFLRPQVPEQPGFVNRFTAAPGADCVIRKKGDVEFFAFDFFNNNTRPKFTELYSEPDPNDKSVDPSILYQSRLSSAWDEMIFPGIRQPTCFCMAGWQGSDCSQPDYASNPFLGSSFLIQKGIPQPDAYFLLNKLSYSTGLGTADCWLGWYTYEYNSDAPNDVLKWQGKCLCWPGTKYTRARNGLDDDKFGCQPSGLELACGEHGRIDLPTGRCLCERGYMGTNCTEAVKCPGYNEQSGVQCHGNGVCNPATRQCECSRSVTDPRNGYTGNDCGSVEFYDRATCEANNGTVVVLSKSGAALEFLCQNCPPGRSGHLCEISLVPTVKDIECNGFPVSGRSCTCSAHRGYVTGCACQNDLQDACVRESLRRDGCTDPHVLANTTCSSLCSGHGDCVTDSGLPNNGYLNYSCECSNTFSGSYCEQTTCPGDCSGANGACLINATTKAAYCNCKCSQSDGCWIGASCNISVDGFCLNLGGGVTNVNHICANHGSCEHNATTDEYGCVCDGKHAKDDEHPYCTLQTCTSDCGLNGVCQPSQIGTGSCVCYPPWFGANCTSFECKDKDGQIIAGATPKQVAYFPTPVFQCECSNPNLTIDSGCTTEACTSAGGNVCGPLYATDLAAASGSDPANKQIPGHSCTGGVCVCSALGYLLDPSEKNESLATCVTSCNSNNTQQAQRCRNQPDCVRDIAGNRLFCACKDGYTPASGCNEQVCSGHGTLLDGKCICEGAWTGSDCHASTCLHGEIVNDSCICGPGWSGQVCDVTVCQNGGTPNITSGICVCAIGWQGQNCTTAQNSVPIVPLKPSQAPSVPIIPIIIDCHHGEPGPPSNLACLCTGLWENDPATGQCTINSCTPYGNPDPTTNETTCLCNASVSVPNDEESMCFLNCSEHGTLDEDNNVCHCDDGWAGLLCTLPAIVPEPPGPDPDNRCPTSDVYREPSQLHASVAEVGSHCTNDTGGATAKPKSEGISTPDIILYSVFGGALVLSGGFIIMKKLCMSTGVRYVKV